MNGPIVVAITGASGVIYARRLLNILLSVGERVHLLISPSGREVIAQELNTHLDLNQLDIAELLGHPSSHSSNIEYFHHQDFMAPVASGSFKTKGMVICPCSGGTLSGVVTGASRNLIQRAAEVQLKENRKLVLVPREMPLSLIHIQNMERACLAGATVMPASPGWYQGVESLDDLVDFVVARILDHLAIDVEIMQRWGSDSP